jgi:hypothetical protein
MQDMKKYCTSQHRGRVEHPKVRFGCPRGRIGRQEDLDGAKEVADQDQGDGDTEGNSCDFDPSLSGLLGNALRGVSAVEDANNGDRDGVEEELYNQTSLEEGEAGADGGVGGVEAEEGGGALSGKGDYNGDEAEGERAEIYRPDGDKRGVGG